METTFTIKLPLLGILALALGTGCAATLQGGSSIPEASLSAPGLQTPSGPRTPPCGVLEHVFLGVCVCDVGACPKLQSLTTVIPPVAPTPNTALVASQKSLELAFAPEVADRLALRYERRYLGTPYPLDIQSWHTTLENGFRNGFRSAFPARQGPSPDMTLRIDKADLEVGAFDHAHVRITYAATLTGADGTVLRTSGIASRGAPRGQLMELDARIANDVSMSVDAMYEHLAKELFATPAAAPPAAGCVPGQSIACVGPQGCQGFQVCGSDGAHFAPCACGK